MSTSLDDALVQRLSEPISSDAPAGVSVRYEPEFEQLQQEIAKLESPAAKAVNWDVVVDLGLQILSEKSKDLQVICYVCRGMFERGGYAGLAQGLIVMSGLINTYWDKLYPNRLRARVAAIEWLIERLSPPVAARKPRPAEREAISNCKSVIEQLQDTLKDKLDDDAPAWGELYRKLRSYANELEQEQAKEQHRQPDKQNAAEAAAARDESVASVQASAPQAIASEEDINKSLRTCKDILRKAALYKREKNLAAPSAYRWLRQATWMDAEQPPMQNNMTQIPPLPAERLAFFEQQVQAGNHAQLIKEVESSFANAPFWLDAHRLTAMALEALGHKDAQQAVMIELAAFLRRLPGLLDCQFMGGKPFAEDLTRSWINDEVLAGAQAMGGSAFQNASVQSSDSPWMEISREAKQQATRGKFRDGVELFQKGRNKAQSMRERFLWEVQQARFCQEAGYVEVAIPQLESLDQQAERYHLDEWEPGLSLEIAVLLLICYQKIEAKSELSSERLLRREAAQSKVSRLDLATALDLISANK